MDSEPQLNLSICPLCGAPNHCAVAADPDAEECWCENKEFPQALLDKVPVSAVRKICICEKCLLQYLEANKTDDS